MDTQETYTAFEGATQVHRGTYEEVVLKVKERLGRAENSPMLIFSDSTGKTMDFNFHGSVKDVLKRLEIYVSKEESGAVTGPGRPKLGVRSRCYLVIGNGWLANQMELQQPYENLSKRLRKGPTSASSKFKSAHIDSCP